MTMIVIALPHWHFNPFVPLIPPHQPTFKIFGVGLALGFGCIPDMNNSPPWPKKSRIRSGLSAGVGTRRAAFRCGIFSAHTRGFASAGNWEKLAYRIFFGCSRETDRRTVAGYMDDTGRNGRQRGPAQQHRAYDHPHAVRYGGRRIPFRRAYPQALALWHAMAGDCFIGGDLRVARLAEPGATDLDLYLAAIRHDSPDSAFGHGNFAARIPKCRVHLLFLAEASDCSMSSARRW